MLIWIKHLVAGPELAELERWRELSGEARSWLSEFPDAASALDHFALPRDRSDECSRYFSGSSRHAASQGQRSYVVTARWIGVTARRYYRVEIEGGKALTVHGNDI